MTNEMIIMAEKVRLQKEGILKYTGRYLDVIGDDGVITKIPEIQSIHTFAAWKALGYKVMKGQKAITRIPIWKYSAPKVQDESPVDGVEPKGRMFMKVSAFFSEEQVEKIS